MYLDDLFKSKWYVHSGMLEYVTDNDGAYDTNTAEEVGNLYSYPSITLDEKV